MSRVRLAVILLAFLAAVFLVLGQTTPYDGQRLILNVYLDETGKALVTGYAQDLSSLSFLNESQYRYENDTSQLYALTNSLTRKDGDLWTLRFASRGYYDDYHVTFYLPGNLLLKKINSTSGLEYFISTSNQSLVADFQGYEIQHPAVTIEYQQPLVAGSRSPGNNNLIFGLLVLLAAASALALAARKRRFHLPPPPAGGEEIPPFIKGGALAAEEDLADEKALAAREGLATEGAMTEGTAEPVEEIALESGLQKAPQSEDAEIDSSASMELSPQQAKRKEIDISSEMAAVMETLTPRERAILKALIAAGGRMTQADLRYETGTPKSSLSGILLSLERRKLIVKKEWGRTNVIELSDWFLSQGEDG
jgi:uncharacterized membrane protein